MKFPQRVQDIINELYRRNESLSAGSDDQRRALMKMIIEQVVFEYPEENYGWKSADPTRPPSKDSMAKQADAKLISWDLFDGTTRKPNEFPESVDITGQNFIPLEGVNHLLGDENGPPDDDHEPPDMQILLGLLSSIVSHQEEQTQRLIQIDNTLNRMSGDLRGALAEVKAEIAKGIKIRFS